MRWIKHCSLHLRVKVFVPERYIGFLADLVFEPVTSLEHFLLCYHYLSKPNKTEKALWEMHKMTSCH